MKWEYRRSLVLSTIPITGSYRYNNIFQILPASLEAPRPPAILNHHPFVIEYRFIIDETQRAFPGGQLIPQWVTNNEDSAKTLKELLQLLTVFSNDRLFVYSANQAWFIPMGKCGEDPVLKEIQWGQEGYYYKGFDSQIYSFTKTDFKPIEQINLNEYYNRYGRRVDLQFDLPNNIDNLFKTYFLLEEEAKKSFMSSCSLFSQGIKLWSEHPSLSFAAIVSSLEALISFDNRNKKVAKCKECKQERYRVVNNFRDFFKEFGSPDPKFKKYALKIYKYRSRILHRGELFLGEIYPRRFGSFDGFEDDELRRSILHTCRICLVNWLVVSNKLAKI